MKKLNITINCCKKCPFLREVSYFFRCDITKKTFGSVFISSFVSEDCPLEDFDGKDIVIQDRFEILDL